MTSRERERIRWAIREIMSDDGDQMSAIASLCEMVGMEYPAARLCGDLKAVDFRELINRPNSKRGA
jgi:hypothetical protein